MTIVPLAEIIVYQIHLRSKPKLTLNWAPDIGAATISTSVWSVPQGGAGLTVDQTANTTTTATGRLVPTVANIRYKVENKVTLSDGQDLVYEVYIDVLDR